MRRKTSAIEGYPDRTTISEAVNVLRRPVFRSTNISVISAKQPASDRGVEECMKAPEVAALGSAAGAVLGAALGWWFSTVMGAITGLESLIIVGPVSLALAGAGAGGVLGWTSGLFACFCMPEFVAKRQSDRIGRAPRRLSGQPLTVRPRSDV